MDRLEFIGSINDGGFAFQDAQNIIHYFDHIMAAYNVVGSYSCMKVNSTINSPLCMTFNVSFENPNQVLVMRSHIEKDLREIHLYGKNFLITPSTSDNNLIIQIQQQ